MDEKVTTRKLAAFLFTEMQRLKNNETTPQEACAQAKLASQLNNTLSYELERAKVQIKLREQGADIVPELRDVEN